MGEIRSNDQQYLAQHPASGSGPFYALVGGAFALLTIARNAQPGMFLDGVTYASIARNLAQGRGGFWSLSYTSTLYPVFHEQPPLGFALQAGAFAIFGDHLAVERVYSVLAGLLIAAVLMLTWRRTISDSDSWLPIVFWLVPPTVTWSIVNNMLDVTQALFAALAVFAFIQSLGRSRAWWCWAMTAGASIVAAVLTKGPTGLFPLAAPAIAALVMRDRAAVSLRSGLVIYLTVAVIGALLLIPGASREAVATYWNLQVAASIRGTRGGGGRLSSLSYYLGVSVIGRMTALLVLSWAVGRFSGRDRLRNRSADSWTWFFLLVALAGSLPIALSARMAGHYFLPSVTFYALGFAGLSVPFVQPLLDRWRTRSGIRKSVGAVGGVLFVAAVTIPLLGRSIEPRDVAWMSEYRMLSPAVPRGATLGTCDAVRSDWGLHAYMQRLFEVSLDPDAPDRHPYFLQVTDRPCDVPPGCQSIATTRRFALHDCRLDRK